jgi:diguanylate cyclase (GGDEF)-like protein/PAS domain S-box-containing protein
LERSPDPDPGHWQPLAAVALEYANDAIVVCERAPAHGSFIIRYANAAFEQQTGYTREEALGNGLEMLYGPQTDRALIDELRASLDAMRPVVGEVRKYRKDGTPFWAEVSIRPIAGPDGELASAVIVQRDVTERIETKEELELLTRAIDYANDGIAVFRWDDGWRIRHVNESFLTMTGYGIGEVIGRTSDFLVGEQTDKDKLEELRRALLSGEPIRGELAFYRKDGSYFWADITGQGLRDLDGTVAHTINVYRDVTEKHLYEERLSFEASHDPLTGVFNRRFFTRSIESAVQDAKTRDVTHGLISFDLDYFKPVNDAHGHEAGDEVLVSLTAAVNAHLRAGDVFGRLGGDEFALLLLGCPRDRTEKIAHQLLGVVKEFVLLWHGSPLRVGASIGAVSIDRGTSGAADALRRVDKACYAAKRSGRNRVVVDL